MFIAVVQHVLCILDVFWVVFVAVTYFHGFSNPSMVCGSLDLNSQLFRGYGQGPSCYNVSIP
jgi:hypothetical protein